MKEKRLILIISILLILLILVVIILGVLKKKEKKIETIKNDNPELTINSDIKESNSETDFYIINNCINDFLLSVNSKESEKAFYLMDEQYKSDKNISNNNILDRVNILSGNFDAFFAKLVNYREISIGQTYRYYVYGELYENDYQEKSEIYVIVNVEYQNNTFSLQFANEIKTNEEDYLNIVDNLKKGNTNEFQYANDLENIEITPNNYNVFTSVDSEKPLMLEEYLKYYTVMSVYYPEKVYNELLNEEYKNKKFIDINEYKNYINTKKNILLNATIKEYSIFERDDYTEYIIVDTNDDYYILRVKSIMNFTVIGDYYTIDLEQITNKYDNATDQEKVAINIQKIISALKDKDYNYIYGKINTSFKNNNYNNIEEFKNKIQDIYVGKMNLTFKNFTNEGNTYIYDINLKGATASNNKEVNMQIIMKLKDNRDFEMSFNIK